MNTHVFLERERSNIDGWERDDNFGCHNYLILFRRQPRTPPLLNLIRSCFIIVVQTLTSGSCYQMEHVGHRTAMVISVLSSRLASVSIYNSPPFSQRYKHTTRPTAFSLRWSSLRVYLCSCSSWPPEMAGYNTRQYIQWKPTIADAESVGWHIVSNR